MATIKDVAKRAGVSFTTVSHVINGTRFVSDAVRERVQAAVHELGYVPSAVARSLKRKNTRTVGVILPNNANPYFAEVIRGVEEHCFSAGYNLILCNSNDDPARQAAHLRVLAEKRVDGLILVVTGTDAIAHAMLKNIRTPLVLLDREISNMPGCDLVEVDHMLGGRLATTHLLELGHPRVACISGPPGLAPSSQRRAGWKAALLERGIQYKEHELVRGDFTPQSGYHAMKQLLEHELRPSAVFVCNDLMALGALHAAQQAGFSVPGMLSIVGFDDIELAAYSAPALTSVNQPKTHIGYLAANILLERMQNPRPAGLRHVLAPTLTLRHSTAPYTNIQQRAL